MVQHIADMHGTSNSGRREIGWWLIATAWFALWHLFITWHVWQDPVRLVPGPIGDNTVMLWNLGWIYHALSNGSPGFWFVNAYYPEGFLFLYGTHTWLDGLFYWLASPLLPAGIDSAVLWANITMLVSTIASGLLLILGLRAWRVTNWPVLILVASGAVFSWFRMFALMGHYHFFGTQWMLLALCLLSWGRFNAVEGRIVRANRLFALAGLALGVGFLNDQTMVVFAAILGGLVILALPAVDTKARVRQMSTVGLRYYGFSLIPASVHLVPIFVAAATGRLNVRVDAQGPRLVDSTSLILPPDFHFLGPWLSSFRQSYGLFWGEGTYVGVVPGLLLLLATWTSLRFVFLKNSDRPERLRVCFYATMAAWVFLVMAMGDRFVIGREQLFTMPGRLLKEIPVLTNIRLPQRWVWPAHLCISLAGSSALMHYLSASNNRRLMIWVAAVFAFIPPLEGKCYPVPQPLDLRSYPILEPMPVVKAVKRHYKSGSVLMMPLTQAYSRGNILQLLWGFDIPLTFSYTAKMPYLVHETPVRDDEWSIADGEWLRANDVTIVVFPLDDDDPIRLAEWVKKACKAVPGLIVLDRHGQQICNGI